MNLTGVPNPMTAERLTDAETIRSLVDAHPLWYHQIELAPGIVTPGVHDSADELARLDTLGLPRDCSGLRVLDIGCRDGFFAFEMERRGAREVVGIDYAEPDITGFSVAAKILASDVQYVVENVYYLDPKKYGTFDLVLFLGVVYHLRHPMLALDHLRSVTKPDGLLFVESVIAGDDAVSHPDVPLWQFLPRDTLGGDATSKWAPNMAGLKSVIEESRFQVLDSTVHAGRGAVTARAVVDRELDFYQRLDGEVGLKGKARNLPTKIVPEEGDLSSEDEPTTPRGDA